MVLPSFILIYQIFGLKLVSRSAQVYQFNTSKSTSKINELLLEAKSSQGNSDVKIKEINQKSGYVVGSLRLSKSEDEVHLYDFTIKPSDNLLILQGTSVGRNDINDFLANVVENDSRYRVVTEYSFGIKEMLTIFKNITKEHPRNIIQIMKVLFEPQMGFEYARETYTELSYKFIENRCASKHADFDEFRKNGKRMYMAMGLIKCTGLVEEVRRHYARLDVNPNCSFRMYSDVQPDEWNKFCFKILDFI
jgi:hypothetical protein